MRYFIDLDNTLCKTIGNDYTNSNPIYERIEYVNNLKNEGHYIVIWTGRGSLSGIDHTELTISQLKDWNVLYDDLLFNKPPYDIYIDDKSFNVDTLLPFITENNTETKKNNRDQKTIVAKDWGHEIIFINNDEYCGKILCFNKGKMCSMHYHLKKQETWYVAKGRFLMYWIRTSDGKKFMEYLNVGDVITNKRGEPHQVQALEDSELFEVSTTHFDEDSYRISNSST